MTHYFIAYEEDNYKRKLIVNEIIDEHPVSYTAKMRYEHPDNRYTLLFWSEIPSEIGKEYQEVFE